MKKTMTLMAMTAVLLSACATSNQEPAQQSPSSGKSVNYSQLQHHNFNLETFNGKNVAKGNSFRQPRIEFNEGNTINGVVCNNFNGQATLEKNILKARAASTMMFCSGELNEMEHALFTALEKGAAIQLQGDTLTLKEGNNTFVYKLKDYVK